MRGPAWPCWRASPGLRSLEYLRLRLRYERLRAAARRTVAWPNGGGLTQDVAWPGRDPPAGPSIPSGAPVNPAAAAAAASRPTCAACPACSGLDIESVRKACCKPDAMVAQVHSAWV